MKYVIKLILLLVLLVFLLFHAAVASVVRYIIYPLWEFKWWVRDDNKESFISSSYDLIKDIIKDVKEQGIFFK